MAGLKVWATLTCLMLFTSTMAVAQSRQEYSVVPASDRVSILKGLQKSPEFLKAVQSKTKVVVCSMVSFRARATGALKEEPLVETMHYRYDDGVTVRTTFNTTEKKVVKVEQLPAYPTPLATEELRDARTLAQEKEPAVNALMKRYKQADLTIQTLNPVVSNRMSKLFGKRLVILLIAPKDKPEERVTVTVNLTDRTIARD